MLPIVGVLVGAVAFGATCSVLKGNSSGLRDAAGNISAPWVILPLLAGAFAATRRPLLGALTGVGARPAGKRSQPHDRTLA
jgi:hypothetical protein